jgi:TatD DNase family protein
MIDAHCHLDAEGLPVSADEAVAEAAAVGVSGIVMAGVDRAGWASQQAIEARHPGRVFPVFGIHPQVVVELSERALDAELAALETAVRDARRAGALGTVGPVGPVALGEIGLDLLTPERKAQAGLQERAMRAQLQLARALALPVVFHLLRADEPALRILRSEGLPSAGGVVHSFSGAREFAKMLVALGLSLSFCGTLTFPQSRRLREAATWVPEDRVLIETDSPYQAPAGQRGRANRPANLPDVARALGALRGWSPEETGARTAANARRLFGIT